MNRNITKIVEIVKFIDSELYKVITKSAIERMNVARENNCESFDAEFAFVKLLANGYYIENTDIDRILDTYPHVIVKSVCLCVREYLKRTINRRDALELMTTSTTCVAQTKMIEDLIELTCGEIYQLDYIIDVVL